MDAQQLYKEALAQATEIVDLVTPADYDKPTPDTEWDVHDLVNHILMELSWTSDIVEGRTMAEVGEKYDGDLAGDGTDLQKLWHEAAAAARQAIDNADMQDIAHVSFDDLTVEEYLCQAGVDQLIHSWDLAKALGVSVEFDLELAESAYAFLAPQKDVLYRMGLFAKPIEVPDNAPIQTKLLAISGRKE